LYYTRARDYHPNPALIAARTLTVAGDPAGRVLYDMRRALTDGLELVYRGVVPDDPRLNTMVKWVADWLPDANDARLVERVGTVERMIDEAKRLAM
jgi:hypothetical protein